MHVLIAIDGSASGFDAARQAGAVLNAEKDEATLFYSVPRIHVESDSPSDPAALSKGSEALAAAVFDEAKKYLPPALAARAHTILGNKDPRHAIVAAADQAKADMIAMGARGLSPITSLLLGSVSRSVVNTSRLPVFVARKRKDSVESDELRVLIAYDGSRLGQVILDLVRALSWPPSTKGRTIAVVAGMFPGEIPKWLKERARSPEIEEMTRVWVEQHEAEVRKMREQLSQYCKTLPRPFQDDAVAVEGHPAERILEEIERLKIDLVLMGTEKRSPWGTLLMGSTSDAVLQHAECSVLLAREQPAPYSA